MKLTSDMLTSTQYMTDPQVATFLVTVTLIVATILILKMALAQDLILIKRLGQNLSILIISNVLSLIVKLVTGTLYLHM